MGGDLVVLGFSVGPVLAIWWIGPEGLKRLPPERRPRVARAVWWVAFAWLLIMLLITISIVG